ncbi:site-specific DNA-methyltransferase [Paenibacillus sp. MAHUQ-46]|uniref:Methyltransferase n=1 Tax=Paenibacillus roseus TaxID=2798579 RepID=A0A934MR88_9BACL|nr:site-specific DNA-methyltransferase [Paenibacillus roseus]
MLYNLDCVDGSEKIIDDESVDLLIADPPYNLGFGGTKHTKTKKPRFNIIANDQLSHRNYQRFTFQWLRQAYRILKPGRHIYVCIDWRMYPYMALWMRRVGFVIKNCITWNKVHMGMGHQYRFQHEFIIFAVKGEKARRIRSRSATDIWSIPRISGNKTIHPTEKPVEVMQKMILNSSEPGEMVVDFFSGSGPVAEAVIRSGRELTAFEIDPHWYEVSKQRIEAVQQELREEGADL